MRVGESGDLRVIQVLAVVQVRANESCFVEPIYDVTATLGFRIMQVG